MRGEKILMTPKFLNGNKIPYIQYVYNIKTHQQLTLQQIKFKMNVALCKAVDAVW